MTSWFDALYPWSQLLQKFETIKKKTTHQLVISQDFKLVKGAAENNDGLKEKNSEDYSDLPTEDDVVSHFVQANGRPSLRKFDKSSHLCILYYVTQGRFRSDKNKRLWYFAGTPNDSEDSAWLASIKANNTNEYWKLVDNPFEKLEEISTLCNSVYEELLYSLEHTTGNTSRDMFKNILVNFRRLPEFVAYQSHRGHVHKQHVWSFVGVLKGGNGGRGEPAKSIPNRIQSIHWYLTKYHVFLGPIAKKVCCSKT